MTAVDIRPPSRQTGSSRQTSEPFGLDLALSVGRRVGVVIARGDLDGSTVSALVDAVDRLRDELSIRRIVIDLVDVRFADIAAIRQVQRLRNVSPGRPHITVLRGPALTRLAAFAGQA